jgi:hypothetical protein
MLCRAPVRPFSTHWQLSLEPCHAAVPSPVDFNGLGGDNVVRRDRTTAIKKTVSAANQMAAKRNTLLTEHQEGRSRERLLAELGLSSILPNANTARTFAKGGIGELDLTESVGVVRSATQAVQAGNLSGLEATLTAQAVALDAIFNEMARRAALNMGEYIHATEVYLRLGLKAQAQCRATLQTLFEMKNPQPIAFVKQANIANGPQQVNNGGRAAEPLSPAGISANQSNELLGLSYEQRLDTRTAGAPGGAHPQLETVGAVVRPEN